MPGIVITFPDGQELRPHVVDSITPGRSSEVTQNEVEDGSSVTDHRLIGPRTLSLSACVSDVPLDATGTYAPEAPGPHVDWRERLETADAKSELLKVDVGPTRGGLYENMLITSLDCHWDTDTGNSFQFTLSLQEFRIAAPKVRDLTAERIAKERLVVNVDTLNTSGFAGAANGVVGGAGATLVDSQATATRMSPARGLGRITAQAAPPALSDAAEALVNPPGLSGNVFDFVNGGI